MKKSAIFYGVLMFILCFLFVAEIKAQNRKAVSAARATGTFQAESGSQLKIFALGKGRLRVAFSGVIQFASADGMAESIGEAAGEAKITGDAAVFKPRGYKRCQITIKFLGGNKIEVKQKGDSADCGFGANVSATGVYQKMSAAKPKF